MPGIHSSNDRFLKGLNISFKRLRQLVQIKHFKVFAVIGYIRSYFLYEGYKPIALLAFIVDTVAFEKLCGSWFIKIYFCCDSLLHYINI